MDSIGRLTADEAAIRLIKVIVKSGSQPENRIIRKRLKMNKDITINQIEELENRRRDMTAEQLRPYIKTPEFTEEVKNEILSLLYNCNIDKADNSELEALFRGTHKKNAYKSKSYIEAILSNIRIAHINNSDYNEGEELKITNGGDCWDDFAGLYLSVLITEINEANPRYAYEEFCKTAYEELQTEIVDRLFSEWLNNITNLEWFIAINNVKKESK